MINKPACCGHCGGKFLARNRDAYGECWECPNCGWNSDVLERTLPLLGRRGRKASHA